MSTDVTRADRPATTPIIRRPIVLAAAAMLVLAVGAAAVAAWTLLRQDPVGVESGPMHMAGSLPGETVVYLELDLEPGGSQGDALAELGRRLGGAGSGSGSAVLLHPLVGGFSDGAYDYERDVAPWFDGHAAFAVVDWGGLGLGGLLMPVPGDAVAPGAVVLLGVEDRQAAVAFTDRIRADARNAGFGFVSRDLDGWTVWRADAGPNQTGVAFAIGPDVLVLGVRDSDIEAIIDLHGDGAETLADDEHFRGEVWHLPQERIGTLYSRAGGLRGELTDAAGLRGGGDFATAQLVAALLPLDLVGAVVVEPDRIVIERWEAPNPHQPQDRANERLASLIPAATGFYAELPEFGRLLSALGGAIHTDVQAQAPDEVALEVARFEAAIGRPMDAIGDWLGDVSVAIGLPEGGELVPAGAMGLALDGAAAGEVLDGLAAWLQQSGVPVQPVAIGNQQGVAVDLPFLFGSIRLEYALDGDVVRFGIEGFIDWATRRGPVLSDEPGYTSALEESGASENAGVVYLPIERSLAWSEEHGSDPIGSEPFGEHVARLRDAIMVTFDEGERVRSRLEIRVAGE